jgi:protease-4
MRDFLKYTFASFLGTVLFCTVSFGGLILLIITLANASKETEPRVENKSILTFDLSVEISDSPPSVAPSDVIGDALAGSENTKAVTLHSIVRAIETAAQDDRIVGLYLYGNINPASTSGFAALDEIRQALETFRESGKPIFAYELGISEREYYLTSMANTLVLNPTGLVEINGYRAEVTFFAGALQKYGIGVQAIRVGRYKSAIEPFTRTESSPEEEEQTRKLLADLWNSFLTGASKNRDLTPQQLQAIADQKGLLLPDEAQTAGLVDKVGYFDEVLPELQNLTDQKKDEPSFRQISLPVYAEVATDNKPALGSSNRIALVYAEGEIVSGEGGSGQVGGDRFARLLRDLRFDEEVKAVVLRINSPGGSATASDRIAREVMLTSQAKPVIVSMGSYAASGGYEIATHADTIFALPTTITGSIGVFGLLPNFQTIANNNGITWDVVKTGQFADADTITRPKTPQELAIIQRVVDRLYDQFISSVAESRSLSKERVNEIAQGRVWSGAEAQRLGLVDELGGLEDAIQTAAEEARLGDDWQLDEYPKARNLEELLLENLLSSQVSYSTSPQDPITIELQRLRQDLSILQSLNDPLGIYSRLPFNPRID